MSNLLAALGQAGLGEVASDFIKQINNEDKMKMEMIKILIELMDDEGNCKVKDAIKELVDKKKIFDFIGGD